jgi:L-ascorbate metabolism protein UlaG (beta-lactamase superfamily)
LIELAGLRLLVDPWLVGPLVFGNAPWFFQGQHRDPPALPTKIDAIVLSQGLPDHANPPTLRQLDHTIPVIASPSAAQVVQSLGFTDVTALAPGESFTCREAIAITATTGAIVGPTARENGYVLRSLTNQPNGDQPSLYYEPHGYADPKLADLAPVDVAIAPLISLSVGPFPILRGMEVALALAQVLRPQVMLSTAGSGGNVVYDGLLAAALRSRGSLDTFQANLAAAGLVTQVLRATPGERLAILGDRPAAIGS